MTKPRNPSQSERSANTDFQPTIVIAAEIAFAAILLFMTNKPIVLNNTSQAQQEPLITIEIPVSNVAVASAFVDGNQPMIRN